MKFLQDFQFCTLAHNAVIRNTYKQLMKSIFYNLFRMIMFCAGYYCCWRYICLFKLSGLDLGYFAILDKHFIFWTNLFKLHLAADNSRYCYVLYMHVIQDSNFFCSWGILISHWIKAFNVCSYDSEGCVQDFKDTFTIIEGTKTIITRYPWGSLIADNVDNCMYDMKKKHGLYCTWESKHVPW